MAHEHEPGRGEVSLGIQLLGQPTITRDGSAAYQPRSRKTWCVLAYLVLSQRPPTRAQLWSLLFDGADDPARALRWCLTEIRRALGPGAAVDGDPVVLRLPDRAVVDTAVLLRGTWLEAIDLPGLGHDLLERTTLRDAPAYDAWLLAQQRHLQAVGEAELHEAALGTMAVGQLDRALEHASRLVTLNPLDEGHQALLIRLYRMSGDDAAAFAIAHEWGHHVQHTVGVFRYVTGQRSAIGAENQADCIGGAFLGYLRDQGILEEDDYADVGAVLPKIASAESDVYRDHGTVEERAQSTRLGLINGMSGCSQFFPGAPLV
jgi:DNA-binding SARP family transcriptional activator